MIRLPTHRNSVACIYFTKLHILFFIFHLIYRKVIDNDLFITYHGATIFLYLAGIDKKKESHRTAKLCCVLKLFFFLS